jgi:rod shape-determining protein MreC
MFYVIISCVLLFRGNSYHQSIYLTSANAVTGSVIGIKNNVTGYFGLKSINESLQERNAMLENEVLNLKDELKRYKTQLINADTSTLDNKIIRFDHISATVINNSLRHPRNYFTIDKGEKDGVQPGMGVVDHNGVVGIVNVSGPHTSRIISLLNVTQHFSVKIKGTPFVGSLSWKGGDPSVAYMEELPRHVKYNIGDTIVTSGFSTTFPEGIFVGTVMNQVRGSDDNFFTLKVHLISDFRSLTAVRVIKDQYKIELDSLSKFDSKEE